MNLCLTCRRRIRTCVCDHIKPFETQTRYIILMHPMEHKKEKVGTGRFTHLILKNSKILVGINFDENREFQEILSDSSYETYLLYPGDDALQIENGFSGPRPQKPLQIIVIDGTWPCAKKMMKLSTSLHKIPRISFTPGKTSEFKIKHQPMEGCLSTVESVYQVIRGLNSAGVEDTQMREENLMEVFRKTVDQQIECAKEPGEGYRRKPFSLPEERKTSKKWSKRLLFFRGL